MGLPRTQINKEKSQKKAKKKFIKKNEKFLRVIKNHAACLKRAEDVCLVAQGELS